jgi:trehalose/maltose transport system substrate-binding protein
VTDRNKQIGDLLKDFRRGRITRRELMVRGSALGVSAFFLSRLATDRAFAQDATPESIAPGSTLTDPQGLRTDLSGKAIAFLGPESSSADIPLLEAEIARFAELTGITVSFVPGEQDANDRLTKYNQALGSQSSDVDVYQIDVIWPGVLAQHALDLNTALSDLAAQHFEAIVQNNTVDGKLIGMPYFTDAGLLYWRQDLLDQYGLTQPATWTDLETSAQTIMDGEKATVADFYGFVFQGKAYEGLTCNALEWQVSNGGGSIVESDGTVSINNEQAAAAFDRARTWIGGIAPEGVTGYNEPSSLNDFMAGRAAFMRNWPYAWANSNDPAQSQIAGKVGVGVLPMGDGEGARNAATLGGWQLMVATYSKEPDAAVEWVRYLCSAELQRTAAIERARLPTIASVYDDPGVAEASEFIPRLKDVFQGGAVARPSSVTSDLYPEVSRTYWEEVNQVLTGAKSGADACASLEESIKEIMEDV